MMDTAGDKVVVEVDVLVNTISGDIAEDTVGNTAEDTVGDKAEDTVGNKAEDTVGNKAEDTVDDTVVIQQRIQ